MEKRRLGRTDIEIEPLIFGCNVLGFTTDETQSFAVLDAFVDHGLTALDTADVYGKGKSETILGNWMKARGNRDKLIVMTKVGSEMAAGQTGLSAKWIVEEVEHSLSRLQTDVIDLYQSHRPDPTTPQDETLDAFDKLVKAGKVRWLGSSNQDAAQLTEALNISKSKGLARYDTIQNEFNLADREGFGKVQQLCIENDVSGIGYFSLARGFLSGKYRSAADANKSPRGANVVAKYINERGLRILATLDEVSKRVGAKQAEVALAWITAQPGVGAAIASGTTVEQVESLAKGARLKLSAADLSELTQAGA